MFIVYVLRNKTSIYSSSTHLHCYIVSYILNCKDKVTIVEESKYIWINSNICMKIFLLIYVCMYIYIYRKSNMYVWEIRILIIVNICVIIAKKTYNDFMFIFMWLLLTTLINIYMFQCKYNKYINIVGIYYNTHMHTMRVCTSAQIIFY